MPGVLVFFIGCLVIFCTGQCCESKKKINNADCPCNSPGHPTRGLSGQASPQAAQSAQWQEQAKADTPGQHSPQLPLTQTGTQSLTGSSESLVLS